MSHFTSILGYSLRQPDGTTKRTRECLERKQVVALYFSSQCFACNKFTPYLSRLYTNVYKGKGMEVVFVSRDTDEAKYKASCNEMPWPAVPHTEQGVMEKLIKLCRVEEVPALVLLTPNAEVYSYDATKTVNDPDTYPWMPKTLAEVLSTHYTGPGPKLPKVDDSVLYGRYIGLYFSANSCAGCKSFAPIFAETYKKLKARNPMKFEVIYVSDDQDEDQFKENFKHMPWIALPWKDREGKRRLKEIFNVKQLPILILLDRDQKTVLHENAMEVALLDREGYDFPWKTGQPLQSHEAIRREQEREFQLANDSVADKTTNVWYAPAQRIARPADQPKNDSSSDSSDSDSSDDDKDSKVVCVNEEDGPAAKKSRVDRSDTINKS